VYIKNLREDLFDCCWFLCSRLLVIVELLEKFVDPREVASGVLQAAGALLKPPRGT
jgi:hypothetical protein